MSIKMGYNVSAMVANNSLQINDNKVSTALERLSSGYKINHAKDNAAGLAIARRMNAQLRGLDVAEQDAKDGESIVEIADGALAEVHDMLQRMNELSVKSATGTITDSDRDAIQAEINQLKDEITRVGQTTEFNGQKLFDGSFDLKGYTTNNISKVNYYSDSVESGVYSAEFKFSFKEETVMQQQLNSDGTPKVDADGNPVMEEARDEFGQPVKKKVDTSTISLTNERGEVIPSTKIEYSDEEIHIIGENGFEIRIGVDKSWIKDGMLDYDFVKTEVTKNDAANTTDGSDWKMKMDLTGIGAMTLQVGANEGQTIDLRIPELNLLNCGIKYTDLSTMEGAEDAIEEINGAIAYVSEMRSRMGAYQNRLGHTESNLSSSTENMTAAYSRIMDTDMATEMTNYTSLQVVSQAATAMLAQANERPAQVLQLLQ